MNKTLIALSLLLPLQLNSYGNTEKLIIWNVGQGQWTTYVDSDECIHIDMGGEKAPLHKALKACYQKSNKLLISHTDYDHISFINRYISLVSKVCLYNKTRLPKYIRPIPLCEKNRGEKNRGEKKKDHNKNDHSKKPSKISKINWSPSLRLKLSKNDMSSVFILKQQVLLPGDSTKRQEKLWSRRLNTKVKWLVLGHHGSNTSTSKYLLKNYRGLIGTIASSRHKKYKHPHKKVVGRLKKRGIPVITTEHWGNIHIYL